MKKTLLISLLSLGLAVGCSSNNKAATADNNNPAQPASSDNAGSSSNASSTSASSATTNNPDQQFINDAAKGNRAEIELGKMVVEKAKDPNVKRFAQMMVDDHTKALNQLQQVASKSNITLPDGIPDDAKDLQDKLSSESGKQLEKDYMDGMVQDHQKDVQDFQQASQNLKDKDVKMWATKTLPTLQKHLKAAQQIDSRLNGGQTEKGSTGTGESQ